MPGAYPVVRNRASPSEKESFRAGNARPIAGRFRRHLARGNGNLGQIKQLNGAVATAFNIVEKSEFELERQEQDDGESFHVRTCYCPLELRNRRDVVANGRRELDLEHCEQVDERRYVSVVCDFRRHEAMKKQRRRRRIQYRA